MLLLLSTVVVAGPRKTGTILDQVGAAAALVMLVSKLQPATDISFAFSLSASSFPSSSVCPASKREFTGLVLGRITNTRFVCLTVGVDSVVEGKQEHGIFL